VRSACAASRSDGAPCGAFALASGFCAVHDPDRRELAREARAKGARRANRLRSIRGKRAKLDTAVGLVRFTSGVIHDALEGELDKDLARVVLYGVSIQRQLVETGELEKRLAALEAAVPGRRRWA
jgi:hypothetical protein